MDDVIWGNMPPKPSKVGANVQFQVKMPKYENRSISKTVNPIKPIEDKAETTTFTSSVGYHYPKPNSTGRHLENRYDVITLPCMIRFR